MIGIKVEFHYKKQKSSFSQPMGEIFLSTTRNLIRQIYENVRTRFIYIYIHTEYVYKYVNVYVCVCACVCCRVFSLESSVVVDSVWAVCFNNGKL